MTSKGEKGTGQDYEKVHTRDLSITTYAAYPHSFLIEGRLHDLCMFERYSLAGGKRPAGSLHEMIVRMRLSGSLVIDSIEAEMPVVPMPECLKAMDSLKPLEGISIKSGFTLKVKELVGGPKGCAHLVSLVLAMASAAVQGAWSAVSRNKETIEAYKSRVADVLVDTCIVWKKDGPRVSEYEKLLSLKRS